MRLQNSNRHSLKLTETYLVPRNVSRRNHPNVLRPFLPEVQKIIEFTHREVLNEVQKSVQIFSVPKLHIYLLQNRLLSLGLELPENTLPDLHPFDETNHSFCEYTRVISHCPPVHYLARAIYALVRCHLVNIVYLCELTSTIQQSPFPGRGGKNG